MKKIVYLLIFGLLVVVAFFIACSNTETPVVETPPGETLSSNGITGGAIGVPVEEKAEEPIQTKFYNNRIQDLMDKTKLINNYQFHDRTLRLNYNNIYVEDPAYEVLVRENKAKIIYNEAKKGGPNLFYNEVYLNFNDKTAYGVCSLTGTICKELKGKAYILNYETEKYQTSPLDLIAEIPSTAKVTGTTIYNNRQVTLVEFEIGESRVKRVYLDSYYGLPLKEEEYKQTEDGPMVLLSREFDPVIVGSGTVKTFDVNLPSELVVSN